MEISMLPEVVNSLGLVANMAGVALAFFYGFPQPSHEEGVNLGLELGTPLESMGGITVAEYNEQVRKRKNKYLFRSRFALGLMGVGFILQLIATLIARGS